MMEKNESRVKVNKYQLGELFLKIVEVKRRIESGALNYEETIEALQYVIENKGYIMAKTVKGVAELKYLPNIVDLNARPREFGGYMIGYHNGGGIFNFNNSKLVLFSENVPKNGFKLRKLKEMACNGNMLDFLLNHQELIPSACKEVYTCFLGTVYQDLQNDESFIRAMYYCNGRYHDSLLALDNDFDKSLPLLMPEVK
ncbi:MAG: hypothetical protein WCZ15_02805 [Patescibacteria group bacterium]|jgi:hypothetical protein|nr:hypothetical protein [Candidatus Falkowbacteria bacterium]